MVLRYRSGESSDTERDAAIGVKSWIREMLGLGDDAVVSIASHRCGDQNCNEAAAIVLLARPGYPTTSIRLSKQLNTVTKAELHAALEPVTGEAAQAARPPQTSATD